MLKKKPGRPAGSRDSDKARLTLIEAASRLLAENGADAVSLRQVAKDAGVTPAMISYYFKDKQGLMHAVLESGLDRILEIITEVASHHGVPVINSFIDQYIRAISAEPWLPQLVVREVLSRNTPYQDVIAKRFAAKAVKIMPPRIIEDIQNGHLRGDLDPRMVMLSLVGMCIFPFLARPLLGPILGYKVDDEFADALIQHTTQLFNEGARVDHE